MSLSIPERIAQTMEHLCEHGAHGYSQHNRAGDGTTEAIALSDGSKVTIHGGDYDCSEGVRVCVNCAISGRHSSPSSYMWTGNQDEELRALGFTRMAYSKSAVRRGDILWRKGHTGVALGNNRQGEAAHDEYGGIAGRNRGDQTGTEVRVTTLSSNWTYIYRYPSQGGGGDMEVCAVNVTVTVKTDRLNIRDYPSTKTGNIIDNAHYERGDKVVLDGLVLGDGCVWGTYIGGSSGKRRYIALGSTELAGV